MRACELAPRRSSRPVTGSVGFTPYIKIMALLLPPKAMCHLPRKGPARRVFGVFFGTTERDLDGDRRASRRLPAYFWPRAEPARDLTAARPNCKSRSAPYHTPHGSRRATDRAPDGSLTETGRKIRRTLGVMTPAGVYAEDMPNGRRFKCDLSITENALKGKGLHESCVFLRAWVQIPE
ncbi:hypothetical protein Bbelb_014950 [Branchiostoma belcheri]|nr:hypothetical protein Bbelb_014950 [Branchiostoma belcheri]